MEATNTCVTRRALGAIALSGAALAATPAAAQRRAGGLTSGNWLEQVQAQHRAINQLFAELRTSRPGARGRRNAQLMELKTLLTAHSIAEEVALYPGVALKGDRQGADKLYREQSEAKVLTAEIEMLALAGGDFLPRLAALEAAINAHVADEERNRYPRLLQTASPAENAKMTDDFRMAFTRYMT